MKNLNILKKVMLILCVLTITFMTLPVGSFVEALSGVYLAISAPSRTSVNAGETVTFTLTYTGDVGNIMVGPGSVVLRGFTANKQVTDLGSNKRLVTLSNVQGTGSGKYIEITGGTAISSTGDLSNSANSVTSGTFSIQAAAPVDTTSPVLTVTAANPSSVYAGGSVTFVAKYTDNVGVANISLGTGSVILNGFTANKQVAVSGNERVITLTNIQGTVGSKTITITGGTAIDAAGNLANSATSAAFTLAQKPAGDTTAPVLTITGPNPASIYAGQTITYVAKYTDNVGISNIWLTANSIVLNGFTANKQITVSGNDRIITLTNIQGTVGSKSISITGGTAADAAGNLSNAATSGVFTLAQRPVDPTDEIAPVLKITGPVPDSIHNGQTITYTATYTDNKGIANIWLSSNTIVLNGFAANVRITGTGNSRTITLTNVRGAIGGSKTISITGGTASDAAGNLSNAATSAAFTILKDEEVPQDPKPQDPPNKPDDWIPNPNTGR